MAPGPPRLWGVEHAEGWEVTQALSSSSTAMASQARGEARAHLPAGGSSRGSEILPHSKQLSDEARGACGNRARLRPSRLSSGVWRTVCLTPGVFSFGPI